MSSPTCVQCGAELFNDPTRCGVCGARQPAPVPVPSPQPEPPVPQASASSDPQAQPAAGAGAPSSSRTWLYLFVGAAIALGGYQYWSSQKEAEAQVVAARAEAEATRKRLEAEKAQEVREAQERARQEAEARVREAEEKAQQATEAASVLEKAARCADARECIGFMLAAAEPRQPQVFQAAATRFSEMATARAPSGSDRNTARDLNRRGLEEYKRGNVSAAIESFTRASRLDPVDAEISGNLGYLLVKAQRLDEASKALSQSIQADPRRSGVWHAVAEYFGPSRSDSAVRALILSYEVAKAKDQVLASYEKLVTTASLSEMRPIYAQAVARIKAR